MPHYSPCTHITQSLQPRWQNWAALKWSMKLLWVLTLHSQHPPQKHHLHRPLGQLLLVRSDWRWTCWPWEPTERLFLTHQRGGSQWKPSLSTQMKGGEQLGLTKRYQSNKFDRTSSSSSPGAATCRGVVGTLLPPDSSSWVGRKRGLSYMPNPEKWQEECQELCYVCS